MRKLRTFWLRVTGLFQKERRDRELAEEIEGNLQFHIEDNLRTGMSPEEARRQAVLKFGGIESIKEQYRDQRSLPLLESLTQDLCYAFRGFIRDRAFTVSALIAIALAVGGAAAVFSVVDRSLFRELPYHHGDRLVSVGIVAPLISRQDWLFAGTYQEWRSSQTVFDKLTSWTGVTGCDLGDDSPQRLNCARIESTFLPTLGVEPFMGRNLAVEEDLPGAEGRWSFWRLSCGRLTSVRTGASSENASSLMVSRPK